MRLDLRLAFQSPTEDGPTQAADILGLMWCLN